MLFSRVLNMVMLCILEYYQLHIPHFVLEFVNRLIAKETCQNNNKNNVIFAKGTAHLKKFEQRSFIPA